MLSYINFGAKVKSFFTSFHFYFPRISANSFDKTVNAQNCQTFAELVLDNYLFFGLSMLFLKLVLLAICAFLTFGVSSTIFDTSTQPQTQSESSSTTKAHKSIADIVAKATSKIGKTKTIQPEILIRQPEKRKQSFVGIFSWGVIDCCYFPYLFSGL